MFEIVFSYYEKNESGYDTSNKLEMKKILGKKKEVSLEEVASYILGQLSRRDIFIFDTQPFEYARRPLTFKETNGGILLKNKKFSLGNTNNLTSVDVEEELGEEEKTVVRKKANSVPAKNNIVSLREEVFGLDIDGDFKISGLTKGKKYKIVSETKLGDYVVVNDRNMEQKVSSVYFGSPTQGIVFDGEVYIPPDNEINSAKIIYGGELVNMGDDAMKALPRR